MRQLHNFHCNSCNKTTEKLVDTDVRAVVCECGETASRTICMPTIGLNGTDPSFPTAWDKWANIREQNHRVARSKSYYKG